MTREDLDILFSKEAKDLIREHLATSPAEIALKLGRSHPAAKLIATQVKYLQKAKSKLPDWCEALCIFTGQSYEQSSSLASLSLRPPFFGKTALDLTCGLGADSWHLAQHFEKVVAIEANPLLAEITRENFQRLGITNVELITGRAEEFIAGWKGEPFDLLFVDPDRRPVPGRRSFLLQDCLPDVLALEDSMLAMANKVLIKASPLLDATEVERSFSSLLAVGAVAVEQEVRELIIELGPGEKKGRWVAFSSQKEGHFFSESEGSVNVPVSPKANNNTETKFILEANPSLYKMGLAASYFGSLGIALSHPQGYAFSNEIPGKFAGRAFAIRQKWAWKPKQVRKELKTQGIERLNLSRRAFDLPIAEVRKQLNVKEGGEDFLLFSRNNEGRFAWLCSRV